MLTQSHRLRLPLPRLPRRPAEDRAGKLQARLMLAGVGVILGLLMAAAVALVLLTVAVAAVERAAVDLLQKPDDHHRLMAVATMALTSNTTIEGGR